MTQRFGWGHRKGGKGGKRHGFGHSKPAVLYQGTTHAREWISTEVTRRLMHYFGDNWPRDREVRDLLRTRSLWFLPVVNPDGYQYTFDHERLWRKNLRDVDGDGEIAAGDGVDLNRNYPERWNYDDEGSSTQSSSDTYRGAEPGSEPETQADMALVDEIDPAFAVSYHSYGPLLLYPQGWQVQTPTPDDPIYIALSGTDDAPAVEGFDPDVAAELYTTNGEFTDWAHRAEDSLAWTPELEEGCEGCGFVFPDDEALVQEQFEKNLPFALDLARSADDPADPESHLGNETKSFYLETVSADPTRANNPLSDFRFKYSYGDPQPVEVIAKRSLGRVTLRYRINGGPHPQRRHIRVGRRRDLRRRLRHLLPPPPRPGDRHQPRRRGRGLVRGAPRALRVVHLHGRLGVRRRHADRRRRGLHRDLQRSAVRRRAGLPAELPGRPGGERDLIRGLRRRRAGAHGAGPSRRAGALRQRRLVHGATTSSPAIRAWSPGPRHASPTTRCWRCART